jgi:hypothetical protein
MSTHPAPISRKPASQAPHVKLPSVSVQAAFVHESTASAHSSKFVQLVPLPL